MPTSSGELSDGRWHSISARFVDGKLMWLTVDGRRRRRAGRAWRKIARAGFRGAAGLDVLRRAARGASE